MRLAIVGSRHAPEAKSRELIRAALDTFKPKVLVSGGCEGVDTWAAQEARARGIEVHEHLPKRFQWAGPGGFKARNADIASECEALVRIAWAHSTTYGSGWTRDHAKRLGKPTYEYVIE